MSGLRKVGVAFIIECASNRDNTVIISFLYSVIFCYDNIAHFAV